MDSATGRRLWHREAGGLPMAATDGLVFLVPLSAGVAAGGDLVYALDEHGGVYALRI